MNASSQLAFLFLCSWEPSHGMVLSTFRVHLPSSVKCSWYHPYRCTLRYVSMVIPNPVKLTMEMSLQTLEILKHR